MSTIYPIGPVPRWPFLLSGDLVCGDGSDYSLATTYYASFNNQCVISPSTAGLGTYQSLLAVLTAQMNAAYNSIRGTSGQTPYSLTINGDGHIQVRIAPNTTYNMWLLPDADGETTVDVSLFGLGPDPLNLPHNPNALIPIFETLPFAPRCQWLPGMDSEFETDEYERKLRFEKRKVGGGVSRNVHNQTPYYEKFAKWQYVAVARMLNSRAAKADYAAVAGVPVGHPCTLENMLNYLDSRFEVEPGIIYLSPLVDSPTDDWTGPYEVILGESGLLDGVKMEKVVPNLTSEHYEVELHLARTR